MNRSEVTDRDKHAVHCELVIIITFIQIMQATVSSDTNDIDEQVIGKRKEWKGVCCDDGTGRNVYYISLDGKNRSRSQPEDYVVAYFSNGCRRYYHRGNCIRCRNKFCPVALSSKSFSIVYSFNICENCLIGTSPSVSRLRGNGDVIWEANLDTPMNSYVEISNACLDPEREKSIITRSREAQFAILTSMKLRRNDYRSTRVNTMKNEYNISAGTHLSWGFNNNAFDEYFGEVNSEQKPHGHGVMWYSDRSVYIGGWINGLPHCNEGGTMIRPSGSQYEGSWVQGFKHGRGKQTYIDGSIYYGEFAKVGGLCLSTDIRMLDWMY